MKSKILVFAATGTQGRAVITELIRSGYKIRAATRNLRSKKAKLISHDNIEFVEVDFDSTDSLRKVFDGMERMFYLLPMSKNSEYIGTRITDTILNSDIKHAIFSSVGGAERNTGIGHFETKWRIEEKLRNSGIQYTILRPAAYMEQFVQTKGAGVILGLMSCFMSDDKKIQMISTEDIARFVRMAFENPDKFASKSIEIAGDELTLNEIRDQLGLYTKKKIKISRWTKFFVPILPRIIKEMLTFYGKDGWQADISELKKLNPDMLTLNTLLARRKEYS